MGSCMDLVTRLYRSSENTNQRILFDIEPSGQYLGTGGQDGLVHVYDLQIGQWVSCFQSASVIFILLNLLIALFFIGLNAGLLLLLVILWVHYVLIPCIFLDCHDLRIFLLNFSQCRVLMEDSLC
ncbi:hypothetical protein K1719_002350 [Acacia pycnantha]|nr:hypothetical protein K1719_002350 [Acacia pycnantha]